MCGSLDQAGADGCMLVLSTDTEVILVCWLEGLDGVAQVTGEEAGLQRQGQRRERGDGHTV